MINAVIQDNEESVGPLADGEVARLLSALQNAEFTRSDKHDLAKNRGFRQRSLIEIATEAKQHKDATEAKQHKDATEAKQQNLESGVEPESATPKNFPDVQSDSANQKKLAATETNEEAPEQVIRDIKSKQTIDVEAPELEVGVRGLTTNPISSLEIAEQEQGIRGLTSVPHEDFDGSTETQGLRELTSSSNEHDEKTTKNNFETASAAFERGKAEGINEGRHTAIAETKEEAIADAKSELADIVNSFRNALDSLARPKAMQVGALSKSINKAILKLASERAGIQIDEMPEAFSHRINALVAGIGQELAEGKVQLNEDDYATMKPYLANLGFEIVVNSNLLRGDVTLQFDGVELHDIAANRIDSQLNDVVPAAANSDAVADSDVAAAADSDVIAAADSDVTAAADSDVTAAADSDVTATADSDVAATADSDVAATADSNVAAADNADLANMLTVDELLPPSDETS